jgi:hypothetical protein
MKVETVQRKQGDTTRELWPSPDYLRQIDLLRRTIGKKVFLIECKPGKVNLGIHYSGVGYDLLDVINFPQPDPVNGIAPHMIILGDGRGVNLGRVARITINKSFNPSKSDLLYQNSFLMDEFLMRERRLSKASIAACSKALLGEVLGKPDTKRVTSK